MSLLQVAKDSPGPVKRLRYVVRSRVQDEKGEPMEGAAVLVGEELVLTRVIGRLAESSHQGNFLPSNCL
ncbi:MAG: hypothetical protein DMG38_08750 [Acidobacteria bacterium]|nr:MAG: hypothetical protein DMG38_08750 [Acidobacteriota bacterium]